MTRVRALLTFGLLALATTALAGPAGNQRPLGGRQGEDTVARAETRPYALTGSAARGTHHPGWEHRLERIGTRLERDVFVPRTR